jgi:DNA-binding transcriptional LysR family regulator
MPAERKLSDFVHDLALFCRIAEELKQKPASLREITDRLNLSSVSIVSSCIRRLADEYGKTLIDITSTSGKNSLTEDGERLFESGQQAIGELNRVWHYNPQTTLRIAASHLLLVYVLPDFVRSFLNSSKGRETNITFNDACEFEETIHLLNNGQLDFALAWHLDGRKKFVANYPFLRYETFDNLFDIVVICRPDHRFANRQFVDINELAQERVYVLQGQHQPFREIIPYPDEKNGGSRVALKDYTTIISNIRMGLNGVAVVPGVYRELDYYQKLGTLVHIPVKYLSNFLSIGIAGIFKVREKESNDYVMSEEAWYLYSLIKKFFSDPENRLEPGWRTKRRFAALLPRSLDLKEYGQAYFMVLTSDGDVKIPEWRRARIDWRANGSTTKPSGKLTVIGSLEDTALCESYDLTAGSLTDNVYYLAAEPRDRSTYKPSIAVTFHLALKALAYNQEQQALYGFCYASDSDGKPTISPFILLNCRPDDVPLPHYAIAAVARFGMLRVSTNHVDRPPKAIKGAGDNEHK